MNFPHPDKMMNCKSAMPNPSPKVHDPKTRQFINIAQELGYDITDLHEMDDRLKNWIADLVDISEELDDTGDISGLPDDGSSHIEHLRDRFKCAGTTTGRSCSKPKTFAQPYGTPVIPSADPEPEPEERVELDQWDVMGGKHRSRTGMGNTKKQYEPDTIDPTIDPMEEIRRLGGRAGN